MEKLSVKSPVFENGEKLPIKYTCDGEGINPPLVVEGIPSEAKSLVLVVHDPDAPGGNFIHWLVWNISVHGEIAENSIPGIEGRNSSGKIHYSSPCPPSGTHRYIFKVFALNSKLEIQEGANRKELDHSIQGYVIAEGELIGLFR
ncbi:MAG: YbhB/YbcL family Raf kinase inhibitor-like protein [Candidatus Bathyarchaeota archaeon]|jgi:Raf kinase inhibitor-like YbhB/YbcL family protein